MLNVVPTGSIATADTNVIIVGIMNQRGFQSFNQVPNYWTVQYITGLPDYPYEILNIIGKMAAISLFNMIGDLMLGHPGLSSYSIGLDGLSQSISSTNSSSKSAFGARISQYTEEIKTSVERLKRVYKGITFTSM
jgi:hypothetical protein